MKWMAKHYLFLVFLCVLIGIGATFYWFLDNYSARYVTLHNGQLPSYSNAGQYLNFVLGIPLTIMAALLGTFVSYQIGHFAATKDDFSILGFVDKVSDGIFEAQSRIAQALDSISFAGMNMYGSIRALIGTRMDDKTGDAFWNEIDAIGAEHEADLRPLLVEVKKATLSISEQYTRLSGQMNSAMFLRMRGERQGLKSPIAYLLSAVPEAVSAEDRDYLRNATLRGMSDALIWTAENRTVVHMLRAYYFMPNGDFPIITYLGLVLHSPEIFLKKPGTLRSGEIITSFCLNIGTAFLVTLYESLPDKDDMLRSFQKLMDMPEVATRYLNIAGPRMSNLSKKEIQAQIDEIVREPNRLIVLYTDQGEAIYFDPKKHGDIRNWR